MAKKKSNSSKENQLDLLNGLGKKLGGVFCLAEEDEENDFISSGHIAINYILSAKWLDGGFPRGKLIEIYGPSQSSKTTLGYTGMVGCIEKGGIVGAIDAEGARDLNFMKTIGVDVNRVYDLVPEYDGKTCYTIEDCFLKIKEFVQEVRKTGFDGPIYILLDSIAACPSRNEWEALLAGKKIPEDQGRRAKLISSYQRTTHSFLKKNDCTLVIINQIRENPGIMFGNPERTTSGKATEYYSDARLDVRRKKTIKREAANSKSSARTLGGYFKVTCTKNRKTSPFREVNDLVLFFETGISPTSGVFEILLMDDLIMPDPNGRRGYYVWVDPATRNEYEKMPLEGKPSFTEKDIKNGKWMVENYDFFGAKTEKEMIDYLSRFEKSFEMFRLISDPKSNALFEISSNGEIDEFEEESQRDKSETALGKIEKQTGGKIKKKKSNIPSSECDDTEEVDVEELEDVNLEELEDVIG